MGSFKKGPSGMPPKKGTGQEGRAIWLLFHLPANLMSYNVCAATIHSILLGLPHPSPPHRALCFFHPSTEGTPIKDTALRRKGAGGLADTETGGKAGLTRCTW